MIQNITGGYKSSAKVVGGTLILSLPDAIAPVVWRMDLGKAKSSAIEVRKNDDGGFNLILKTPKADAHTIASYELKIKATRALMVVTKAISKATVEIKGNDRKLYLPAPSSQNATQAQAKQRTTAFGWCVRLLKYAFMLLSVVIIIGMGLLVYKFVAGPTLAQRSAPSIMGGMNAPAPDTGVRDKTGEVISADDFFKGK